MDWRTLVSAELSKVRIVVRDRFSFRLLMYRAVKTGVVGLLLNKCHFLWSEIHFWRSQKRALMGPYVQEVLFLLRRSRDIRGSHLRLVLNVLSSISDMRCISLSMAKV